VITRTRWFIGLMVWVCPSALLLAGGSGLNVLVVVNQASTNSVQLGNYFAERRQVPPQNVVGINWTGGNTDWIRAQFEAILLTAVTNAIATRGLANQIDYVVLSMDLPHRVLDSNGVNGTTAALYYGFKPDDPTSPCTNCPLSCSLPIASASAYAGSEGIFRQTPPGNTPNTFLCTMLTGNSLAEAKALVDAGVDSDATYPTNRIWLEKTTDIFRNVRFTSFDNAEFNLRVRGSDAIVQTNSDQTSGLSSLLGLETGLAYFDVSTNTFTPGAMADSLTSYGGLLFGGTDQTNLLAFTRAGAAGSYGTVVEPCNYLEKFPSPQNYFYQARGFSLAECYYQSLANPYQGLIVGEPLAAPFARLPSGSWSGLATNGLLSGTTNLSLQFAASDPWHPIQQINLFLDGVFLQTLTNIAPGASNALYVTINGFPTNWGIAAGVTIKSVVSNMAAVLNDSSYVNSTKVSAFAHGDRIELQSFDTNNLGSQIPISVSNSIGSAPALTTFISASRTNFLDTVARGRREIDISGTLVIGDYLQLSLTKTNSAIATVSVTNSLSSTDVGQFVQTFVNAINAAPDLQGVDGLTAEDFVVTVLDAQTGLAQTAFNLRPRSVGWAAARLPAQVTGTFTITPATSQQLDENLGDLQPRNHLYVTAGVTNFSLAFAFNTTMQADGYHELTAVAYEGSHVRTQKRVAQSVVIQNTALSATFTCLVGDTNTALEATLQFSVAANTTNITRIELFSTGGSLASSTNQSSAVFSVAATNLGIGLHPFFALVTRDDGKQYRTQTKWIRIIGPDPPFPVSVTGPAPTLAWPATAGRRYDILIATNITDTFGLWASVTNTNCAGQWVETNAIAGQRFYRLRVSP
jgi:uncharacterized protein (TIGR03790 family)